MALGENKAKLGFDNDNDHSVLLFCNEHNCLCLCYYSTRQSNVVCLEQQRFVALSRLSLQRRVDPQLPTTVTAYVLLWTLGFAIIIMSETEQLPLPFYRKYPLPEDAGGAAWTPIYRAPAGQCFQPSTSLFPDIQYHTHFRRQWVYFERRSTTRMQWPPCIRLP